MQSKNLNLSLKKRKKLSNLHSNPQVQALTILYNPIYVKAKQETSKPSMMWTKKTYPNNDSHLKQLPLLMMIQNLSPNCRTLWTTRQGRQQNIDALLKRCTLNSKITSRRYNRKLINLGTSWMSRGRRDWQYMRIRLIRITSYCRICLRKIRLYFNSLAKLPKCRIRLIPLEVEFVTEVKHQLTF